jgi:two-component system LytT family response regulator
VQMPDMDGFAVLRALSNVELPAVIFVTAHDAFAVRAFDVHAIDYVLKPVAADRFARALARARGVLASHRATEIARRLRAFLQELDVPSAVAGPAGGPGAGPAARLLVRTGSRDVLVATADVDWIEADDYCSVLHVGPKRHVVRETLGSLEARLDSRAFARVHRSAIVNLSRVTELVRHSLGRVSVVLRDGTRLAVSRTRRAYLMDIIGSAR